MKNIIMCIGIISINMFFIISSIVGYEYGGASESNIYKIYCFLVAIFNIGIFAHGVLKKKIKLFKKDLFLIIGIPLFLIINMMITLIIHSKIEGFAINYYFKYFLLWSYPAILIGVYIARNNIINDVFKYIDCFVLIGTIAAVVSTINQLILKGSFTGIGGATYQVLSYIAAFTYGLNLYTFFYGELYVRFGIFRGKKYKIISFIFLFLEVFSVIISGGRGGIVLVLIYSLYIFFMSIKVINYKLILKNIILASIFITIFSLTLPVMLQNKTFKNSYDRVFAFIADDGGINWDGTSGRDIVYLEGIDEIKENLLLGKGFFLTPINPHNLFLEILINGGVIYLVCILMFILFIIYKLKKIISSNEKNKLVLIILLYPTTMLMFSGTYLTNTELWFCLSFIISYKYIGKEELCEKN